MFKKLIKFIMNITKFHKIPTNGASNSNEFGFPKIGLLYNKKVEIVLFRFPDDYINFPTGAFGTVIEDFGTDVEILFHGTYDDKGGEYVDSERGKSISELKLDIFRQEADDIILGDMNGEPVATLLGLDPEVVIPIAGTFLAVGDDTTKFAAIMNGTIGYGYTSVI